LKSTIDSSTGVRSDDADSGSLLGKVARLTTRALQEVVNQNVRSRAFFLFRPLEPMTRRDQSRFATMNGDERQ